MRAFADSHVGLVREENQDVFRVLEVEGGILAAVFDGMGGMAGGKVAAEIAAAEFTSQFSTRCAQLAKGGAPTDTDLHHLASHAVYAANAKVLEAAVLNPEWQGMGTTLCAAYLLGDTAYIASIGDTRAYLVRGKNAFPLTQDDSVVAERVAKGEMTREEARKSRERHFLTRALGAGPYADFHFVTEKLQKGDRLLLVSDGFYAHFSDEEIGEMTENETAESLVRYAIEQACERGGEDNVTVAVIEL